MNLKEDYPEHYDGCNEDHHDEIFYQTIDSVDQQPQWHSTESAEPPPPAQRVLVYDTLQDSNYIHSTDENYLLPTILGTYYILFHYNYAKGVYILWFTYYTSTYVYDIGYP